MKKECAQNLSLAVLSQIDAIIILMNLEFRLVMSNSTTARLFGYKNQDDMIGMNAFGMRCPAVEFAESFVAQDLEIIKSLETFEYLDIHTYADRKQHILLTKKSPFYQNNQLMGILCYCIEIKNTFIQKTVSEIIKSDRLLHKSLNNRSYVLNKPNDPNLSEREIECLFYLSRGYTAKEIAIQLKLSYRTIETYVERIKEKTGLTKKSDLIDYSLTNGLMNYIPKTVLFSDISVPV